ncbi:glycosyltransferase [archaeon]|jgi:ubiquinone/menaquinone biosynthesis C-methylase UbiE|nr:glycosyltransferase [archaeon]MBT4647078.1 glycosyltransferase [archaeon]MBT6820987.1 glycosyltransferase [archaeon]MBT7392690.1 glycosyltransferase [archaeon]
MNKKLMNFFNKTAKTRKYWIKKNIYYSKSIRDYIKFLIEPNSDILELGCGTGDLLNSLKPKKGVGIDFSEEMVKIASKRFKKLEFIKADVHNFKSKQKFDYIIISDSIGYFEDIEKVFENLKKNCTPRTRIIITYYNFFWEPLLKLSEFFNLKMSQPFTSWLSKEDIKNLLYVEGYDTIKTGEFLLFPKNIPFLSTFLNKYVARLPLINKLNLVNFIVARPVDIERKEEYSVSVVIPARNEEGNIENALKRMPRLGSHTEIVFVEGNSSDNTYDEIKRVAKEYSKDWDIKYYQQEGKGKGDAVRKGFSKCNGDILMILDADLTVPPKDLKKFYNAIAKNKGEFINGTRLVYPMEKESMRTLNLFGNRMFSLVFTWLLDQRFKDTLCGTKVLFKDDYEKIVKNRKYFGDFDPFGDFDLIFGASKLNLKIVEIPVRYKERTYGSTNISRFKHGWLLIKMCLFASKKIKFV